MMMMIVTYLAMMIELRVKKIVLKGTLVLLKEVLVHINACFRDAECTISGIKTSLKGCESLSKDDYEDLDLYVTLLNLNCDKYKIYCSGNALKKLLYSILILLFIL